MRTSVGNEIRAVRRRQSVHRNIVRERALTSRHNYSYTYTLMNSLGEHNKLLDCYINPRGVPYTFVLVIYFYINDNYGNYCNYFIFQSGTSTVRVCSVLFPNRSTIGN